MEYNCYIELKIVCKIPNLVFNFIIQSSNIDMVVQKLHSNMFGLISFKNAE